MIKLLSTIYHWLTDDTDYCCYCAKPMTNEPEVKDGLDYYCSSSCWYSKCSDDDRDSMNEQSKQ